MEVSHDELSKLMMVGTKPVKEIQEIKRAWGPKPDKDNDRDKEKDKDKKGKGRWRKKGDAVNPVAAEEDTPTTDAPYQSPGSQGPQLGPWKMVPRSTPPHPRRESSIPPDVYPAECQEQDWTGETVAMAG